MLDRLGNIIPKLQMWQEGNKHPIPYVGYPVLSSEQPHKEAIIPPLICYTTSKQGGEKKTGFKSHLSAFEI